MVNLSTHYKEISPEETVLNVIDFFTENGLRVDLSNIELSESGSWYCHVNIYLGDTVIVESNGKGVDKRYALASGYAEAYERFCNGMSFYPNPYFTRTLMDYNYKHNHYYFRKDEKILTYNELVHCCDRAETYFKMLTSNLDKVKKAAVEHITLGIYVGVPLKNLDGSDEMYIDPRLMIRICRSIGMAAGNTVEEALVLGLSECVEKQALLYLFTHFDESYNYVNLDNIKNEKLQEMIKNIKALGYDFYLFDLSYNCNVPTMMSLLINRKTGVLNINFGSFPVFEIAAERVITELYQGINSFNTVEYRGRFQSPYKMFSAEELFDIYGNSISGEIFPAVFFKNIKQVESYNTDVFVDKNTSNQALIQYYVELGKKTNIKYYFIDNSLSDKIKAVHILADGKDVFTGMEGHKVWWNNMTINQAIKSLERYNQFYDEIFNNKAVSMVNLIQLIIDLNSLDKDVGTFIGYVVLWHNVLLHMQKFYNFEMLSILIDNDIPLGYIQPFIINSFIYIEYKKYLLLRRYVNTYRYNTEELLFIFNNIFNYNITQQDIENCQQGSYLLSKVYITPLQNYIHSEEYLKLIQLFASQ